MTLIIDDFFIKIDKILTKEIGKDWLKKIGVYKYNELATDNIKSSIYNIKKAFDDGDLLF